MVLSTALAIAGLAANAIAGVAGAIKGAKREREARAQQQALRQEMKARNTSAYLEDYYSDYLKRADAQNALRTARDMMKAQSAKDRDTSVITGATPEASAARQYDRNRVLAGMIGNLGAMGERFKERAKNRYLSGAARADVLDNAAYEQQGTSGNNLMYNGIRMIGNTLPMGVQLFPNRK